MDESQSEEIEEETCLPKNINQVVELC